MEDISTLQVRVERTHYPLPIEGPRQDAYSKLAYMSPFGMHTAQRRDPKSERGGVDVTHPRTPSRFSGRDNKRAFAERYCGLTVIARIMIPDLYRNPAWKNVLPGETRRVVFILSEIPRPNLTRSPA